MSQRDRGIVSPLRAPARWMTAALLAGLVFASGVAAAPAPEPRQLGFERATQAGDHTPRPFVARPGKPGTVDVEEGLLRQMQSGASRDFAIEFRGRPDLSPARQMEWIERGRWVAERLQNAARRSQAEVQAHLRARGTAFRSYWIKNVILVEGGDVQLLNSLMGFADVARIRSLPGMRLIRPEPFVFGSDQAPKVAGSNIARVGADQVWADGITGAGTVVGVIDSGVRFSHEALVTQYRGNLGGGAFDHNYNWFDPVLGTTFPAPASSAIDDQHGTHVAGTIVGDDFDSDPAERDQVGMAPGAKWIACQGFPASGSVDAALLGCGQFMLAPTDLAGANPDPGLRPMAVNNSWGDCGTSIGTFYSDVVDSWNAAGIIPVFAGGNASNCGYSSPPGLNTVGNPGRYTDVFTVGSTGNNNGLYAPHSNWGPTDDVARGLPDFPDHFGFPDIKPDVVAPGVSIRSTIGTTDSAYDSVGWTGTSMSTPHVVGLMALMFEAGECLVGDFARVGTIIKETANPVPFDSGAGTEGPGFVPNYATGWGEIDAVAAVAAAAEECGPSGFVEGTVTAFGGGPIEGAQVEIFVDEMVQVWSTTTDELGNYSRRVPELLAGGYTVRASAFGFDTDSVSGVLVAEDAVVDQDFVLDASPFHTVSGAVTDATTGWPLHARLVIAGFPGSPVHTDPVTGQYSVDLPEGAIFGFTASSLVDGYQISQREVGPLAGGEIQDFSLDADLTTCVAPGYEAQNVLTEDFETGSPPAGWSISSNGVGWLFGTDLGSFFFSIPAHTRYAATNDDDAGSSNDGSVDFLVSPSVDLSSATSPTLSFESFFTGGFGQLAAVEYSTDGSTWLPVGVPSTGSDWSAQVMSLAAAAGEASVQLRFHSNDDGEFASGWAIDDVEVSSGCTAPVTGGLVVGTVSDANTGAGINGASVTGAEDATVSSVSEDPAVGDGFYVLFADSAPQTVTADPPVASPGYQQAQDSVSPVSGGTVLLDLELTAGRLAFTPAAGPVASVEFGASTAVPFEVENTGTAPVEYALLTTTLRQDFEGGPASDGWTVVNNGGDCVWLSNEDYGRDNFAGGDGLSATADSDACGDGTTMDTSLVSPRLELNNAGSASLDFVMSYRHLGSQRLDVDVSTDGGGSWTTLLTQSASDSASGPGTPTSVDLSPYVGGINTYVRFRFVSPGWNWWAQVDQVRISSDDISAHPWLSAAPAGGLLADGAFQLHDIGFDGGAVDQPGLYETGLILRHDTPYPVAPLVASMNVTAPADFATVSGTVQSLGYCDASPTPAAGASVLIEGGGESHLTSTDANGEFSWQLSANSSPVSITVSHAGSIADQMTGVALAAGMESQADIDLRSVLPCFSVVDDLLEFEVAEGGNDVRGFTLANAGAGVLDPWMATVDDAAVARDFALSQSLDPAVAPLTGVACGANGVPAENFFMRVYDLGDESFVGPVDVTGIRFGVETATSGTDGTQPAEGRLYRLDGPLAFANMTLLESASVSIPDGDLQMIEAVFAAPVTVAADDILVATLYIPDADADGHQFFPGANSAGETSPSFIASADCGITEPTPYAGIGFPDVHLRLDVEFNAAAGCYGTPADPGWLVVDPDTGTIAPDSSTAVEALVDATGLAVGSHVASICLESADPGQPLEVLPVVLDVTEAVAVIDLATSVAASAASVQAGDNVDFTVSIANEGVDWATGVSANATIPAAAAYVGATGTGWSCNLVADALSCAQADPVAAAGSAADLVVTLTATTPGMLEFTATASGAGQDDEPGNDAGSAQVDVQAVPTADLALTATASPDAAQPGSAAHFELLAANVGGDAATGVTVSVVLPVGLSLQGHSGAGWSCSEAAGTTSCVLAGSLAAGFAPALGIDLQVAGSAPSGSVDLAFTIEADQAEPNLANNQADMTLVIQQGGNAIFGDGFEDPAP